MKKIYVEVATRKVGSQCAIEFDVDDDTTPEQIEEMAREQMFEMVDWYFTVDGKEPL